MPRRRAEKALTAVIQEACVQGISSRSVDDPVKAMGMDGISKSQVSRLCGEIDEKSLPREGGGGAVPQPAPGRRLALSAERRGLCKAAPEQQGRHWRSDQWRTNGLLSVAAIIALGVNRDGRREGMGMDIGASEAEPFWTAFLGKLTAGGCAGSSWRSRTA